MKLHPTCRLFALTGATQLVLGLVLAASCRAQMLTNTSFEAPAVGALTDYGAGSGPTGWTVTTGTMAQGSGGQFPSAPFNNAGDGTAEDGNQLFALPAGTITGMFVTQYNLPAPSTFTQTVLNLQVGTVYTVSYYVSALAFGQTNDFGNVEPGDDGSYTVTGSAGGVTNTYTNSLVPPSTGILNGYTYGFGTTNSPWVQQTFQFTATTTSTLLSFSLQDNNSGANTSSGTGSEPGIDNVTVSAPAPEPGTWAMLALGGAGLLGMARRRERV